MSDDFCQQVCDLYSSQGDVSNVSMSSSTSSLSSSGGGGSRDFDAIELTKSNIVPRAIKLFGKRCGYIRSVQIATVACGIRSVFVDCELCYEELNKGSAKKSRAYEFVQFVQQLLPFIGFSLTPMSFSNNGVCKPCEPVWYDQRRIGWRDVHRLHLPDDFSDDVYSGSMFGLIAPLQRDMRAQLSGININFALVVSEGEENNDKTTISDILIAEFVPYCIKNALRLIEEKKIRLENVAQSVLAQKLVKIEVLKGQEVKP